MRYVVYGAGAIGGVIGAHLALAGLPTSAVARGEHLARIRQSGLVLDTQDGQRVVDLAASETAARGLDTEIHYRVGELVLLGRLHGVPTPTCERVLSTALVRTYR